MDWESKKTEALKKIYETTKKTIVACKEGKIDEWTSLLKERQSLFDEFEACDEHIRMSESPNKEAWLEGLRSIEKLDQELEDFLDFAQSAISNKTGIKSLEAHSSQKGLPFPLHLANKLKMQ